MEHGGNHSNPASALLSILTLSPHVPPPSGPGEMVRTAPTQRSVKGHLNIVCIHVVLLSPVACRVSRFQSRWSGLMASQ